MISLKPAEEIARQYLAVVLRAVAALPKSTARLRIEIYRRAERAQRLSIEAAAEPIEREEAEFHTLLFQKVCSLLEGDIRAGLDVFDPDYYPDQLDETARGLGEWRDLRLARKHALAAREARKARAGALDGVPPELQHSVRDLASACAHLDAARPQTNPLLLGLARLRAQVILQAQLIAAQGRMAVLWLFIQPVAMLMVISVSYFVLQLRSIMNMDVPTFALLGATSWIMMRRVMAQTASSYRAGRSFINFPTIRPLSYAIAQGLIYLVTYALVLAAMIVFANVNGWSDGPHYSVMLCVYFVGLWMMSVCIGVFSARVATFWPFFLQLSAVLFGRALWIFSSVFYVTEQFPEAWKPFVLWCPTAHGMQLLRQAYFSGYVSTDASPRYFWGSVICFMIIAAVAVRVSATRVEPV